MDLVKIENIPQNDTVIVDKLLKSIQSGVIIIQGGNKNADG